MFRNNIIDMIRGIAALAVVIHHMHARVPSANLFFNFIGEYGYYGVDVFFIISGWVVTSTLSRYNNPLTFVLKRYIRVVVPFFPLGISYYLLSYNEFHILSSLFLMPAMGKPALSIGWTLQFEVLFYILLGFVIAAKGCGIKLFVAAIFILSYLFDFKNEGHFLWMLTSNYMIEFAVGILISAFSKESLKIKLIISGSILTVLFCGHGFERQLVAIFIFSLLYFVLYLFSRQFMLLTLSRAGLISYSTYLIHLPIISILYRNFDLNFVQLFSIGLPIIYFFSWVYYRVLEKKITQLFIGYVV